MQELASLDLPQIDLFDPAFSEDPHAVYAKARQSSWLGKYKLGHILLDQISSWPEHCSKKGFPFRFGD